MTDASNAYQEAIDFLINFIAYPFEEDGFHGNYKWSFSAIDGNSATTIVHSSVETDELVLADDFEAFITLIAQSASLQLAGGLVLQSFPGREIKDGFDSGKYIEEVRGWAFDSGVLFPKSSQEIMDMVCINPVTGEKLAPEPNVHYLDA